MIKTIIFDLGNVIVNVDWSKFYAKLNEFGNIGHFSKGRIEKQYFIKAFDRGDITPEEFCRKASKSLNISVGFGKFRNAYNNIFSLNKDVDGLIRKLKRRFRLILLSNTNVMHFEYIKNRFDIVSIFDEHVLSYEVGHAKPNTLIFIEAVKKSKALPFNCLYFDDILEFVIAARLVGIKAFQYKNYEKLVKDLKRANAL